MNLKPLAIYLNIVRGFLKAIFNHNTVFPWILILISAFLCFKSFLPGTWLSGWDTLHPEFNFGLSFDRILNGVFRSEQGVGAVTAHAHIADLPRVLLLSLSSIVVPESLLRYLFISLCLIIGVLGTYFFIRKIVLTDKPFSQALAFLGALFYLLNLGTLQHFYVPFEMFTVAFATLPWLFFFATRYLIHKGSKNLIWFGVVTLLSTPMAFASTLWLAYFLALIFYLIVFIKVNFKKVLILVAVTLAINSFWLLPNIYFVISGNANFVPEAKSNKIFSQEAFSYNQNYGTIADTLMFKNFLFDWTSYDDKNSFEYLFATWREHIDSSQTQFLGDVLVIFVLVGLSFGVLSRNKVSIALILPTVMAIIFLINQNPPLDGLFSIFREKIPLFSESLRFPFTKFSIILMFAFSCFFALGQKAIIFLVDKIGWKKLTLSILTVQLIIFSTAFYLYMKPAFLGDFISAKVQVKIPKEYFEMFKWFETQPKESRVANFPVSSLFGWIYYNWGFQGAQFISFGIKQPLFDRDYDRWNPANEQYFREMSYAIYSQNNQLLDQVMQKYQIKYLLLDRNVINPGSGQDKKALFYDQIESLFASDNNIELDQQFGNISIYKVKSENRGLVSTPETFVQIKEGTKSFDIDIAFNDFGTYISPTNQLVPLVNYPYRFLMDNQNYYQPPINNNQPQIQSYQDYVKKEPSIPVSLFLKQEKDKMQLKLVFKAAGQDRSLIKTINIPKSEWLINLDNNQTLVARNISNEDFSYLGELFFSTNSPNNLSFYDLSKNTTNKISDLSLQKLIIGACSEVNAGSMESLQILNNNTLKIIANNVNACVKLPLDQVVNVQDVKNLKSLVNLSFKITSSTGSLGHFCLFDSILGRCVKEQKYLSVGSSINDYFTVDSYSLDKLSLIFYADGLGDILTEQITYADLTLSVKEYADLVSIFPDEIQTLFSTVQIVSDPVPVNNSSDMINIFEKGHKSSSCSNILPKKYSRILDTKNQVIEYSSEEGSSCDFFSLPDLPHNTGYLLSIESQNVAGLPLRVCLANPISKRCDLYISLPNDKQFTKHVILVPPMADGGVGYDLHFDNYSTGRIVSTNKIKSLSIEPFPYYWLTSIYQPASINPAKNNLSIKSVKEILPSLIQITYDNSGNNSRLLVLNRSFEEGWFMRGGEHVLVNNWANGWVVEPNQTGTVIIFFWPQLLEWLGFGALILTFVLVITKRQSKNS